MSLTARVMITLKNGVLDPQGVASQTTLKHLGYSDISQIRQGKIVDVRFDYDDKSRAEKEIVQISEKLLANLVIENFEITWLEH